MGASDSIAAPGLTSALGEFASETLASIHDLTLLRTILRHSSELRSIFVASHYCKALSISFYCAADGLRSEGKPYLFIATPGGTLALSFSTSLSDGFWTTLSPSGTTGLEDPW